MDTDQCRCRRLMGTHKEHLYLDCAPRDIQSCSFGNWMWKRGKQDVMRMFGITTNEIAPLNAGNTPRHGAPTLIVPLVFTTIPSDTFE